MEKCTMLLKKQQQEMPTVTQPHVVIVVTSRMRNHLQIPRYHLFWNNYGWQQVMNEKLFVIHKNDSWQLVSLPLKGIYSFLLDVFLIILRRNVDSKRHYMDSSKFLVLVLKNSPPWLVLLVFILIYCIFCLSYLALLYVYEIIFTSNNFASFASLKFEFHRLRAVSIFFFFLILRFAILLEVIFFLNLNMLMISFKDLTLLPLGPLKFF